MTQMRLALVCLGIALVVGACGGGQSSADPSLAGTRGQILEFSCGQSADTVAYGPVQLGSVLRLTRHTPWQGDDNWADDMGLYVGMASRVTELAGVDEAGCAVVRVEADDGTFVWRLRDQQVLAASPVGRDRCGQSDANADFLGLYVGLQVRVNRHSEWFGDANWAEGMTPYDGSIGRITELVGVDQAGCPGVRLDIDNGAFFWRARDLRPMSAY